MWGRQESGQGQFFMRLISTRSCHRINLAAPGSRNLTPHGERDLHRVSYGGGAAVKRRGRTMLSFSA